MLSTIITASCQKPSAKRFSTSFTGSFDTVIQIIAYADHADTFALWADLAEKRFAELHQLFDIYNAYPELNNLHTINENAGIKPVQVDQVVIDLLRFCLSCDDLSPGTINITLGPVLSIWHDVRTRAALDEAVSLPSQNDLEKAARLSDLDNLQIDAQGSTVYLALKGMKLDVGAVAKGYATELVSRELIAAGMTSGIISAGGSNVRLIGRPADPERETWQIGLQNPFSNPLIPDEPTLDTLLVNDQSVVTSGDYQRYFIRDGVVYHHLIDSRTLQPARHFRAVTVMTTDSGLADYLSSALFLLPYEESRALVEKINDCEALWVFPDGHIETTPGMQDRLKSRRPQD